MHTQKLILLYSLEIVGCLLVVSLGLYILGFLLHTLSRKLREAIAHNTSPRLFLYFFFPGIMIHEISHLLTALLFLYKIEDVKLIDFAAKDGSHGHVISRPREVYNFLYLPKLWQLMGHLFIGIAPLVVGPLLILIALYFWVPGGHAFIHHPGWHNLPSLSWAWGIWLYMLVATLANIELSSADLDGVWQGFLSVVLAVFIFVLLQAEAGGHRCFLRCTAPQKTSLASQSLGGD